jgi:hypothetical protein
MTAKIKPLKSTRQAYATSIGPGMRWLLFSFFMLGAMAIFSFTFLADREDFWLLFWPFISGGLMIFIVCFARSSSRTRDEK